MGHKLLLLTRENERYRDLINALHLPHLSLLDDKPEHIQAANIWLAEPKLAAPLLPHAKNLQWLQSSFAGIDALITPRSRKDYLLTNIKGIFGPLMSEYLFGYLLAHIRGHRFYANAQQQQRWQVQSHHDSLAGKKLLLLGAGSIAQHLALTAQHFGMTVVGINRSGKKPRGFDTIARINELAAQLAQADVIANVLPSTQETRNLLDKHMLACLKPQAILFNLGRGDALDLDALNLQLQANPQQQAILDVFVQEPLCATHPIWQRENAIITPHISAPSQPEQIVDIFSQNYRKFIAGESLAHKIDFDQHY